MKLPVWSYTFLSTYDRCPKQAAVRFIERKYPFEPTAELDWGNYVHDAMEHRIADGTPLPPVMEQWEKIAVLFDELKAEDDVEMHAEMKLGVRKDWSSCGFFDDDVWGRGKLDVTVIRDDVAVLTDWKTGKVWEDPLELWIQAALLKAKYPQLKTILGSYVWLKEDLIGVEYNLSDVSDTVAWINTTMAKAEASNFWVPRRNALCGWCALVDCPNWRERKK